MIIYKATNLINGKIYIGFTVKSLERRINKHLKSVSNNSHSIFHNALRKYGENNFKWEILCEAKTVKEIKQLEIDYIKKYNSYYENGFGYNMTFGGDGGCGGPHFKGHRHSEETKEKMRKGQAKFWSKSENRKKQARCGIDNPNYGKKCSDETRKKISLSHKKNYENGYISPRQGVKLTEEQKQKLRHPKNIDITKHNTSKIVILYDNDTIYKKYSCINEFYIKENTNRYYLDKSIKNNILFKDKYKIKLIKYVK